MKSLFIGKLLEKLRVAGSSVTVPKEVEEQVLSEMAAEEEDSSLLELDAEADMEDIEPQAKPTKNFLGKEFDINVVHGDLNGVRGRFVNLVDLIPPLPKKGDFEVSTIKNSPYFFS